VTNQSLEGSRLHRICCGSRTAKIDVTLTAVSHFKLTSASACGSTVARRCSFGVPVWRFIRLRASARMSFACSDTKRSLPINANWSSLGPPLSAHDSPRRMAARAKQQMTDFVRDSATRVRRVRTSTLLWLNGRTDDHAVARLCWPFWSPVAQRPQISFGWSGKSVFLILSSLRLTTSSLRAH
jgi:hypothetical protein